MKIRIIDKNLSSKLRDKIKLLIVLLKIIKASGSPQKAAENLKKLLIDK